MTFGTVRVGRLVLREALTAASENLNAQTGERSLAISGQEASPPLTVSDVATLQDDILGLKDSLVPVIFTHKSDRNGYYIVKDANTELNNWVGAVVTCSWELSLTRVGSDSDTDIESRLAGALTRSNMHGVTGERWHAPPIGHFAYWSGSTLPSAVTRTGADGPITVYRGVTLNTHPRYACLVGDYLEGRVAFLDEEDRERSGTTLALDPTDWTMTNGLVRVRPLSSSGVLEIAAHTGSWAAKSWDLRVSGASLGPASGVTLLRNDPECVIVRLIWTHTVGRTEVDLTLRRGSRFVEMYLKRQTAATIRVQLATTEAGATATGYIRADVNDADGNRYIVGSAKSFQVDIANGAIFQNSVTTFDAFIGAIAAGSAAVAGDAGDELRSQYLGAPSETVRGVRR